MTFVGSVASGTFVALVLLVAAIAIEYVDPIERYSIRDRLPGFVMNVVTTMATFALMWPLAWLWQAIGLAPLMVIPLWQPLESLGTAGFVAQVVLLVVVADFLAYWRHRAEHAWFWKVHVVHHAPRELHAANSIAHPLQILFSFAFITVPMSLFQIDGPATPFVVSSVVTLLAIYIHSPVRLHFGPLRTVIVDNRFHRIHHSLEEHHFDKNFGICFAMWDHMFGTAYEPGEEWPAVGVSGVPAPRTVSDLITLPFRMNDPDTDRSEFAGPEDAPLGRIGCNLSAEPGVCRESKAT